jgi:hypothetical protein
VEWVPPHPSRSPQFPFDRKGAAATSTPPQIVIARQKSCVNKLVSNRSSMETAKDCVPTSGRKEPLAVQGDSYTPSTRH